MNYSSFEQIFKAPWRKYVDIEFPEVPVTLRIGTPNAGAVFQINALQQKLKAGQDVHQDIYALVLSEGLVQESGKPLCDRAGALKLMSVLPIEVTTRIFTGILDLLPQADEKKDGEGDGERSPGGSEASPSES